MTYLSVCAGIEAASVAWQSLGWQPWAFAEIDKFPCAVLAHHYPETPNLGDLTQWQEWPDAAVDLLVGGTPCQSFSVAGLRQGLADPRGGLLSAYLAVARRYRPRWVVWENVLGVLSSNDGRDFGTLLGGLAELGYGFAYRVLDAQYFGLAQRRARVFVVGYLGDWRRAAAVLVESESLSGHPAPRRDAGEVASTVPRRRTGGGGLGTDFDCDGGLVAKPLLSGGHAMNPLDETLLAFDTTQITSAANYSNPRPGDPCHPLAAGAHAPAVAFADLADPVAANQGRTYTREGTGNFRMSNVAIDRMSVRRLTPRECERLQGFPDDYTLIPYRGKPASDGPRYKALGNSMAVPVVRWIGERIAQVDALGVQP